jgi:hypothetical protein
MELVVIDDLDIAGIAIPRLKTDSVLIVDPDAVLPFSVNLKRLQLVARRHQRRSKQLLYL